MEHGLYVIGNPEQAAAFYGLVLPEVFSRLEEPPVFLIGAVEGNVPVGAAVMELHQGLAELLSIAVATDHRCQGIASALLRQCVRMLRRTSIQTLYTVLSSEETEAASLLSAFGMIPSDACGAYYQFPLDTVTKSKALNGSVKGVISLERASNMLFRSYIHKIFPLDPSVGKQKLFDPKISQVFMEEQQITACLLAECADDISISWISSQSSEKMAPLYLLRGALAAATSVFPPETTVSFTAFDPAVIQLADRLLGEAVEKHPIRQWELANHYFRLIDTTPTGWEEDTHG